MSYLLLIDALINLLLGLLLLFFPESLIEALGIPPSEQRFYPTILGAVLFGIGIALLIQLRSDSGLGLRGAVAINLCGGLVLAYWLLFGSLPLPTHGLVALWIVVVVLVSISAVELISHGKRRDV